MTNQQAPEIYTLHTVPNKGERPWSGIYTVRADAEHDAKVMRDVTGRDWSVVRLVVADTHGLDMHDAGEVELSRISVAELAAKIRAKQAAKPRHSPLPQSPTLQAGSQPAVDALAEAECIIDNPSAWSNFDQRASDAIAAVCKALRAARAPAGSQPAPSDEAILSAARNWGEVQQYNRTDGKGIEYRIVFNVHRRAAHFASELLAARAPEDSVTAPAGGANWQDISTAPKDGTRFVAVGNNYGLYSETQHVCIAQWFRDCWMEVSDWNETSELKYLTHWMPLLPLPGNAARKQGGKQ